MGNFAAQDHCRLSSPSPPRRVGTDPSTFMESLGKEAPNASLLDVSKLSDDQPEMPKATLPEATKISMFLDAATAKAGDFNPQVAGCLEASKPFIIFPVRVVMC